MTYYNPPAQTERSANATQLPTGSIYSVEWLVQFFVFFNLQFLLENKLPLSFSVHHTVLSCAVKLISWCVTRKSSHTYGVGLR